jgi:hypothetical protein
MMIYKQILFRANLAPYLMKRFSSNVRIEVCPKVSLVDQKIRTVVSGLRPSQKGPVIMLHRDEFFTFGKNRYYIFASHKLLFLLGWQDEFVKNAQN